MKRLLCWILSLCLLLCLVPGAAAAERVTGTLERRAGYDLASVRCELADGSYFFASVEETAAGYAYAFDCPAGTYTVKPEYFSTTVWDGAVDISWYDASQTAFSIDTPAKLAGLAALVNGQVDAGTPDYRIKGDRSELVSTRVDDYLLVGAGGGSQYGTAYVGDAAHDFSDKTVYLTADLDMGGSSNWTPVGGLYPMDRDNTERVIVAYFNGTLDGQGHRITNLFCDRYAEKGYAYSQGVGLIGHMGDLYDGEAAPETAPAVRNLSVSGSIYGRRMVGGIVGRTGSIPTGIYLENCANHASVKNTDSKVSAASSARAGARARLSTAIIPALSRRAMPARRAASAAATAGWTFITAITSARSTRAAVSAAAPSAATTTAATPYRTAIISRAATTIRPRTAGTAARRSRASSPSRPCRRRTCARRSSLTR